MHERLRSVSNNTDFPSVMCVGDDWQSIYGWRGSSPQFFLRFAQYFKGSRKQTYRLRDNYRSSSRVIAAAESALVDLTEQFPDKQGGIAKGKWRDLPFPVALVTEYDPAGAVELVRSTLENLPEGERLFVLTRASANPAFVAIEGAFWKEDPERFLATTFHQSKGLEAEYVILIHDTRYTATNVLRNALYRMAGLGRERSSTPYDDAQRDEARRLAYVGVTRAKKVCIWLCEPADGGTFALLPEQGEASRRMTLAGVSEMLDTALGVRTASH
jgi:superfamily I DNA/RNA helicase